MKFYNTVPDIIATIIVFYLLSGNQADRIIGGAEAEANSIPFHVGLTNVPTYDPTPNPVKHPKPFCGGALLTPWHVITAAHCMADHFIELTRVLVGKFSA